MTIETAFSDLVWPAIPKGTARLNLSMLFQLEQSQWWPPEKIRDHQMRQISKLMSHAIKHVPYYRDLFAELGIEDEPDMARHFDRLPLLSRAVLQEQGGNLNAEYTSPNIGPIGEIRTSGSSGRPVVVRKTRIDRLFYNIISLRDILWHRRDMSGMLAVIRIATHKDGAAQSEGRIQDNWGDGVRQTFRTGPAGVMDIRNDVEDQAAWLREVDPDYLLTYPSNAAFLAQYFKDKGLSLAKLKQVITISETLTPQQREEITDGFGVGVADMYSCQELGYIALQSPDHDHYLVQVENVLVEILDENDKPCGPGQMGRVVLTGLHNFATPLIRYDIGDLAEVGEPCPSGRGLPVLSRVLGRVRNLMVTPDGRRFWPGLADARYHEVAPVKQFQITQKDLDTLQVTLVCPRDLTSEEESGIGKLIQERCNYPFTMKFRYVDQIERLPNGKFEDFRSELTPDVVAKAVANRVK